MSASDNPKVYMDIAIGLKDAGRLVFELFAETVPLTVKNFISLCRGDVPHGQRYKKRLHYLNSIFHRVIKGFMCQAGDFEHHDGTGGESIYGPSFDDESFVHKHTGRGVLAMANSGPNTNGSQFYILFKSAPHLNGKHVVFGRVVRGAAVLNLIEAVKTDDNDRPLQEVRVIGCGEWNDEMERAEEEKRAAEAAASEEAVAAPVAAVTETTAAAATPSTGKAAGAGSSSLWGVDFSSDSDGENTSAADTNAAGTGTEGEPAGVELSERQRRVAELRARMGNALKHNHADAREEFSRLSRGGRGMRSVRVVDGETVRAVAETEEEAEKTRKKRRNGAAGTGTGTGTGTGAAEVLKDADLSLLGPAVAAVAELDKGLWACESEAERKRRRAVNEERVGAYLHTEKGKIDVYERKAALLPQVHNANAPLPHVPATTPSTAQVEALAAEVRNREKSGHDAFSRRRRHYEDAFVAHANAHNERVNKKIAKDYDKYTADIKAALERGSAL